MDISIIIPTYNRHKNILQLIESINNNQTLLSKFLYEIIVVSNLKDPVLNKKIKKKYSHLYIKLISCDEKGANKARNLGGEIATGDILLFIDDDCRIDDPKIFNKFIKTHKENTGVAVVGGRYQLIEKANVLQRAYQEIYNCWSNSGKNDQVCLPKIVGGCLSIKKRFFNNLSKFSEQIIYGSSETEFISRLCKSGHSVLLDENIIITHNPNVTFSTFIQKAFLQALNSRDEYLTGENIDYNISDSYLGFFFKNIYKFSFSVGLFYRKINVNEYDIQMFKIFKVIIDCYVIDPLVIYIISLNQTLPYRAIQKVYYFIKYQIKYNILFRTIEKIKNG